MWWGRGEGWCVRKGFFRRESSIFGLWLLPNHKLLRQQFSWRGPFVCFIQSILSKSLSGMWENLAIQLYFLICCYGRYMGWGWVSQIKKQ